MPVENPAGRGRTVAIMDLGSNSLRMMIVRIGENRVTSVLNQVKQMVRLGEGAFEEHRLQPEPMRRTIAALRGFAGMCRSYGVDEIVALATAAVRDAANGQEFMDEVRRETGVDFTVISGREEARLICRGVSVALEPFAGKRMFIDIGGGSTELSVAEGSNILELESLKLGAVRLAGLFPGSGPVSSQRYAEMQKYVRDHAVLPLQRMEAQAPGELVGSSGTIQSLAEMAVAMARDSGKKTGDTAEMLSYSSLRRVVKALCERNEEERMSLPGMNPRRTGILIQGAAILQTIMEELDFDSVRVSGRGLRDGALADYLERLFPEKGRLSVRDESVLRLARLCRFEETHSRHVAKLALMLFDSARELGLYRGPARMRELLHYAAPAARHRHFHFLHQAQRPQPLPHPEQRDARLHAEGSVAHGRAGAVPPLRLFPQGQGLCLPCRRLAGAREVSFAVSVSGGSHGQESPAGRGVRIVRPACSGACARHARHGALPRGAGAYQALPQGAGKVLRQNGHGVGSRIVAEKFFRCGAESSKGGSALSRPAFRHGKGAEDFRNL